MIVGASHKRGKLQKIFPGSIKKMDVAGLISSDFLAITNANNNPVTATSHWA